MPNTHGNDRPSCFAGTSRIRLGFQGAPSRFGKTQTWNGAGAIGISRYSNERPLDESSRSDDLQIAQERAQFAIKSSLCVFDRSIEKIDLTAEHYIEMIEPVLDDIFSPFVIPFASFDRFDVAAENSLSADGVIARRERKALRDRTDGAIVFTPFVDREIARTPIGYRLYKRVAERIVDALIKRERLQQRVHLECWALPA